MHLYHDYETLSLSQTDCIITNCAYYAFDIDRFLSDEPYTFKGLLKEIKSFKFKGKQQQDHGWKTNKETMAFWKTLPEDVRMQIVPSEKDQPIEEFVSELTQYVKDNEINDWWANGVNFDCVLTKRLFDFAGVDIDAVLPFWGPTDTRTYMKTRFNFTKFDRKFEILTDDEKNIYRPHIAAHDVAVDILRIQKIEQEYHSE